jgi:hypothetical protein
MARPFRNRKYVKSMWFNLDNGSGTTIDDILLVPQESITIIAAKIVYVDATTGTVAAGNVKLGTTVGGADVVAATAYANTATVGSTTDLTVLTPKIAANTMLSVRHTGVATTAAGQAFVQVEYTVDG